MNSSIDRTEDLSRASVIERIKNGLRRRSGRVWSVTGGRGTASGWIKIDAPPARCTWRHRLKNGGNEDARTTREDYEEYDSGQRGGFMSPKDRADLALCLGLESVHIQGHSIPSSNDHYREALARAEGRPVEKIAQPYWD